VPGIAAAIGRLEDEHAIENLQRSYGFYVDKALWQDAADLFADDGTLEIGGRGVFVGKKRIHEYLAWLAPQGLTQGHVPTLSYSIYPATFVPPYHYKNPVTGR
jgi:hypothetical protein